MVRCNKKQLTRRRFHGSRRKTRESACQGRANNVAVVRRPSVLSNGTKALLLTVGEVACLYLFMRCQRKKKARLQVHKTQALSIKHLVLGCLEGVFALGQVYVLVPKAYFLRQQSPALHGPHPSYALVYFSLSVEVWDRGV